MGLYICEKHDQSGFVETCEHVKSELTKGIYGQVHRIEVWGTLLVCDVCLKNYGLEYLENNPEIFDKGILDIDDHLIDEYFDIYEKIENRAGWCSECIAEVQVKQARKNGEVIPFPVFERTITFHDSDILKELYKVLVKEVQFQKSVVDSSLAIGITAGGYKYPVTVKIYYITTGVEQRKVIQLVDNFFKEIELNQVRIKFYEAEVWKVFTNPEKGILSRGHRGKEKLLKEVYLNC